MMKGQNNSVPWMSPWRVWTLAAATFTQLVRMKVFYILLLFAGLLLGVNFIRLNLALGPETLGDQELTLLKNTSVGAMRLFATLFSISATALLLPRDMEDRTLYTILCKPVPRLDYLLGKLLGVVLLVGLCLLVMDLAFTANLYLRTQLIVNEQTAILQGMGYDEASMRYYLEKITKHGPTWGLQLGILTVWLESIVLSAVALLISTISSSTLFTMVASFGVYFIGLLQADARAFALRATDQWLIRGAAKGMVYLFPDLQIYSVVDAACNGETYAISSFGWIALVSLFYVALYTILSWFAFAKKEF